MIKQVLGTVFTLLCVGGNCLVIRKTHSVHSFASKKLICGLCDVGSLHPGRRGLEMVVADTLFPCSCVQTHSCESRCVQTHSCGTLMNHPGHSLFPCFLEKTDAFQVNLWWAT